MICSFNHSARDCTHQVHRFRFERGNDRFARGAYSYATPETREAQALLRRVDDGVIFFSGEALYAGPDMGTVEAALASGQETSQALLMWPRATPPRAR